MFHPVRRMIEIEPALRLHRCPSCERRFATPGELCLHEHRCAVSAHAPAS